MPLYPPFPAATTSIAGIAILDGTPTDIQLPGTPAAGSTGKVADAGHVHPRAGQWAPGDSGLLGANFDLSATQFNNTALTAGTLYLARLTAWQAATITNLWIAQGATGSGASTGTYVGLYSSGGTLLTGSADQHANFTTFGEPFALTTPQAVTAGTTVWAAVLVNLASTQPKLMCGFGNSANIANSHLTAANYLFADNGTGLTALPASFTPSSNDSGNAYPFWVGYS